MMQIDIEDDDDSDDDAMLTMPANTVMIYLKTSKALSCEDEMCME